MVRLADAQRPREGITLTQFLEQVAPDEKAAESAVRSTSLAGGRPLRALRIHTDRRTRESTPPAVLVSWLPALFFRENTLGHASITVELSNLGCRCLSNAHELKRGCQHQAGAGSWHQSEVRLAPGSSDPRRFRQWPRPSHVRDRSRWMRPTSAERQRTNMPPSEAGSGVWVVKTQSSASSIGPPAKIGAEAVDDTKKDELQGYLEENVRSDAIVYSYEMKSYEDLPQPHEAVRHGTGEFVRGEVHTNSLESFWLMLKRGYVGIYHWFSQQHLDRYVKEYAKRRSMRELYTIDQMTELITQFWGVRLSWSGLVSYRAATW